MKKRNGFTLIELLAVIVILSLIALIAIPIIMNVIESSKKGAYTESLRNLIKGAEYYEASEEILGNHIDFEKGLSVFDSNIELKNKNFIAGKIKKNENGELYLDMVSDGVYCGMGTIDQLNVSKGSCGDLDTTVPSDIVITENKVTSNSITIAVSVTTGHSGVKYYEYSMDGGSTYTSSTSSSHTFTGLKKDTDYSIKVKVTGGNNLTGESEIKIVHTSDVEIPTYEIVPIGDVWAPKKTVTITYPEIDGYRKEYSIDKGVTWNTVTENTKKLEFTENGTIIARLTDGVNVILGETIQIEKILYEEGILDGAVPELKEGMIPVTIDNDGTVKIADRNKAWYSYQNKNWANAVLVNNESREKYMNAHANTIIPETDILSYFVWIPRYKYQLWYTEAEDETTNLDTSKVHSIDIVFENKNRMKSLGNKNGEYLTHPAFTFGNEELNGIWVGKFETGYFGAKTKEEAEQQIEAGNRVMIKPNVYSWRNISISNSFMTTRKMSASENPFGLQNDSDTHMMKNTEWGSVAYLSHSIYGTDGEVFINNNSNFITGCGGLSTDAMESTECTNAYGTVDAYPQTTTGNITGIFDMSGGAWERVMAYSRDPENPYIYSGFTEENFPESKYIDIYPTPIVTEYSKRILGDATGEMGPFYRDSNIISSWYGDYSHFFHNRSARLLQRGAMYSYNTKAGIFAFDNVTATFETQLSFRIVLS